MDVEALVDMNASRLEGITIEAEAQSILDNDCGLEEYISLMIDRYHGEVTDTWADELREAYDALT